MLSNYFVYDIPASLKDLLRQNMGLDKADFEVRGGDGEGMGGEKGGGREIASCPQNKSRYPLCILHPLRLSLSLSFSRSC